MNTFIDLADAWPRTLLAFDWLKVAAAMHVQIFKTEFLYLYACSLFLSSFLLGKSPTFVLLQNADVERVRRRKHGSCHGATPTIRHVNLYLSLCVSTP